MFRVIRELLCGWFTGHYLIKDEGAYRCDMCLKRVEFYKYDIRPTPKQIEQELKETYEFLLDHEYSLCGGG
jgi:hypothetical protein